MNRIEVYWNAGAVHVTQKGAAGEFWLHAHIWTLLQLPQVTANFLHHNQQTCMMGLASCDNDQRWHQYTAPSFVCSWHLWWAIAAHLLGLSTRSWGATNKVSQQQFI